MVRIDIKKMAPILILLLLWGTSCSDNNTPNDHEYTTTVAFLVPTVDPYTGYAFNVGNWYLFNVPQDWTIDTSFIGTHYSLVLWQNSEGTWDTTYANYIDLYEVAVNVSPSDYVFFFNTHDSALAYPEMVSMVVNVPVGTFYKVQEELYSGGPIYNSSHYYDSLGNSLGVEREYLTDNFSVAVHTSRVTYE